MQQFTHFFKILVYLVEDKTAHLLEQETDFWAIQHLIGHGSVKTTESCTNITEVSKAKIPSPLDYLSI